MVRAAVLLWVLLAIFFVVLYAVDAYPSTRGFAKRVSASPKAQRYLRAQLLRKGDWNAGLRKRMTRAIQLFARRGRIPQAWCDRRSPYGTGSKATTHNTWVCERARICVAVGGVRAGSLRAKIRSCADAAVRAR